MLGIALAAIGHIASYATLLGLYLTLAPLGQPRPEWHWAAIATASLIMLLSMVADVRRQLSDRPKSYTTNKQIRTYMNRWMRSGGRVISLSRDLSWVDDENERVLLEKARRSELILCVEKPTALTERLTHAGATIYYYGASKYIPKSRFTIVDFERDGARVAVGVNDGANHVIQVFRSGHHPLYAMAEDIVRIIMQQGAPVK